MNTRLAALLAATTLTLTGLTTTLSAGPALADPPPEAGRVYLIGVHPGQNPNEDLVANALFEFQQNDAAPVAGTAIHVSVTSCGQFIQQGDAAATNAQYVSVGFSPTGDPFDPFPNSVNQKIGKSIEFDIDVTQPGYDSYRISGSYGNGAPGSYGAWGVKRPSCEEILSGTTGGGASACSVEKWSKKAAVAGVGKRAVVGHTVKVTKAATTGCTAKYAWRVNGKKVASGTSFKVTSGMRGKTLAAIITAGKGKAAKTKTLTYGRVTEK